MPAHTMQCFHSSTSTSRKIDRINRNFFWNKIDPNKVLPMAFLNKICRPTQLGGLGLRKTEAVNSAFLRKT